MQHTSVGKCVKCWLENLKRPLGLRKHTWDNNINTDHREMHYEDVKWNKPSEECRIILLIPISYRIQDGQNLATERSLSQLEHLQFASQVKVTLIRTSSMLVHPWHYKCLVQILCQGFYERFPHLVLSYVEVRLQLDTLLLPFLFKILNCMHFAFCDLRDQYPTIYFLHSCKTCAGRHVILFQE